MKMQRVPVNLFPCEKLLWSAALTWLARPATSTCLSQGPHHPSWDNAASAGPIMLLPSQGAQPAIGCQHSHEGRQRHASDGQAFRVIATCAAASAAAGAAGAAASAANGMKIGSVQLAADTTEVGRRCLSVHVGQPEMGCHCHLMSFCFLCHNPRPGQVGRAASMALSYLLLG